MPIGLLFFGYLAIMVAVYWIIPQQTARSWFLALISIAVITYYDWRASSIVIFLSLFSYGVAVLIETKRKKLLIHRLAVCGIAIFLVVFKYLGLLTSTLDELQRFFSVLPVLHFESLLLPLGISYITFKHISYLTDVYWKVATRGRFVDLLCYSSLFTIFVAGPIERFERFKPQVGGASQKFSTQFIEEGFRRIVYGLFKKYVIADWIGYFASTVWGKSSNGDLGSTSIALLGFSLQIYFDFSGYSDIAIGSSKCFGLTIMENFNWQYLQPNISQFWRSWHISLSDWIRDYVYFPLSNAHSGILWNLVAVPVGAMALCGLWHGAAWHYVIWGVWHGVGISVHQFWNRSKRRNPPLARMSNRQWFNVMSIAVTFVFVTIGWWWLR